MGLQRPGLATGPPPIASGKMNRLACERLAGPYRQVEHAGHGLGVMTAHLEGTVAATDERAVFARLADRELDRAYRLAAVILGDPVEAQDATHDAVVAAWRRFDSLHDPNRFEPWFTRILVNTCRDRLRRRRRQPAVEIDLARDLGGGRDAYADVDDRLALDGAFNSLSPDHRVVVVLRFYADLSVEEIAERIGAPAGTVKSRLHYATRRMHAALANKSDLDD